MLDRAGFVTVVTGCPRSGTTLMMRMLFHGGVSAVADSHVSFESGYVARAMETGDWSFLADCEGRAVKILEPLYRTPPSRYRYQFILMRRDATEQARSFVKFHEFVSGERLPDGAYAVIAESFRRDYPKIIELLGRMGGRVLQVEFENVLSHPREEAKRVETFLGLQLDVESMARQVIERGPECLPYLLEERIAEEQDRIAGLRT